MCMSRFGVKRHGIPKHVVLQYYCSYKGLAVCAVAQYDQSTSVHAAAIHPENGNCHGCLKPGLCVTYTMHAITSFPVQIGMATYLCR